MKSYVASFCLAAALASCSTLPVGANIDFAKTNYGILNSGAYQRGTLFLWNNANGAITVVGTPGCLYQNEVQPNPIDIETRYEFGLEASMEVTAAQKARIESEVRSRTVLVAKGARRFLCTKILTNLSRAIADDPSLMTEWSFYQAERSPDMFYLFISDVTVGDSVELRVDNEVKGTTGFEVSAGGVTFLVKLSGNGLEKIQGDDVVLMFNVKVLRPRFIDNGAGGLNPAFEVINGMDLTTLPAIMRNIGKSG